jgi:hypothetical protein
MPSSSSIRFAVAIAKNMEAKCGGLTARDLIALHSQPCTTRIIPFGMRLSARLCVAMFLFLACTCPALATFQNEKLRASGAALADTLRLSRNNQASSGIYLAGQEIHNPRHSAAVPAVEGAY